MRNQTFYQSLGSLRVKTNPFDVKFNPQQIQQAHGLVQTIPSKSQFENNISVGGVFITGIGVIDNARLFLCNYQSDQLCLLSIEQQHLTRIDLSGRLWGIIVKEDEDKALVALPSEKYIPVVNTATMTSAQKIKCPGVGRGITLIGKDITLGRRGDVSIIDKEGRHLRSITMDCPILTSLYYGKERTLLCCDPNNDKLHCVNVDGTVVFSYSSDDLCNSSDVAVDV